MMASLMSPHSGALFPCVRHPTPGPPPLKTRRLTPLSGCPRSPRKAVTAAVESRSLSVCICTVAAVIRGPLGVPRPPLPIGIPSQLEGRDTSTAAGGSGEQGEHEGRISICWVGRRQGDSPAAARVLGALRRRRRRSHLD
ncbi:unnamed protein product [Gadus morhua 'NCC']